MLTLIFKNGFVGEITFSGKEGKLTKIPLALFWMGILVRNVELLKTLIKNKWPLGVDPGGHHLLLLNVSINKKPVFLSYVVTFKNYRAV